MKRGTFADKFGVLITSLILVTAAGCAKSGGGSSDPNAALVAVSSQSGSVASVAIVNPAASSVTNNASSLVVSGTCALGANLAVEGNVVVTDMVSPANSLSLVCTAGTFSVTIGKTVDGTYPITIHQTSLLDSLASVSWTRNTVAPPAPTVAAPTPNPYYSNTSSVTLNVNCVSGDQVGVSLLSTPLPSQTCSSAGTASFALAETVDGTYSYSIQQTDILGNVSPITTFTWDRITVAPPAPVIINPASNPFISNNPTLSISGSCQSAATVYLTGSATQNVACVGNAFSFTVTTITVDGTYPFSITQVDQAGNISPSASLSWQLKTTAPTPPVIARPAVNPTYSNVNSLVLSGTCDPNSVRVSISQAGMATPPAPAVPCSMGTFAFAAITEAADGTYNFSLVSTDAAGNLSSATGFQWILDRVAPAAPVLSSPASNPYYNNVANIIIAGSCEANATVHLADPSGGSTSQACSAGLTFSYNVSQTLDGSYSYAVTQTDLAGNTSSGTILAWNLSRVAPSAPTITAPTSNPFLSGDTNLIIGGACNGNDALSLNDVSAATTTPGSCVNGGYSFTVTKNVDGTYNFSITDTNIYGNTSSPAGFQWTRNTTIPATPTIISPLPNPYYNNVSPITLTVGCASGDNVNLTNPSGAVTTLICPAAAPFQVSYPLSQAANGNYVYGLTQDNGVYTSASLSFTWNYNTTPPLAVTIVNPPTNPYTAGGNLTLSGACQTGATVNVSGSAVASSVCSASSYMITIVESVDATYNFSLSQTDPNGNTSPSVAQQWIRNSAMPPAPTIASPTSNPYYSNLSSFTISGFCSMGMNVNIAAGTGTTLVASEITSPANSLTQLCSTGAYAFTIAKTVDATYNFLLTQTDNTTGNTSGSVAQSWVRDTVAPVLSVTAKPAATNYNINSSFTFSSNETGTTFQCQLDAGAWVSCVSPDSFYYLAGGSHTFSLKGTDRAGNVSTVYSYTWIQQGFKTMALYHLDSAAPTADGSLLSAPNMLTNSGATSVAGKFNQAENFNGASSMSAASTASLNEISASGTMTIEAFVQFNAMPGTGNGVVIMGKSGASPNLGWEMHIRAGSNTSAKCKNRVSGVTDYCIFFIGSSDGLATTTIYGAPQTMTTGVWYHMAITYNLGSVTMYFNGSLAGTGVIGTAGSTYLFSGSTTNLFLGQTSGGASRLNGVLDEVRLSQIVRTITVPTSAYSAD